MSDHLPLARPAGRLSAARRRLAAAHRRIAAVRADITAATRRSDPLCTLAWFDAYFTVIGLAVLAIVVFVNTVEARQSRLVVVGLIAALGALYVGVGRPLVRDEDYRARAFAYQTGVLVLFTAAVALIGSASFLLFALCPLAYMTLRFRPATAVVVLLNAVPCVVFLARTGELDTTVRDMLPMAFLVTAFSVIFGGWVKRVIRQSSERGALIDELNSTRAEVVRLSHEAGVAAERQRLAGEIHDTIAQGLSSLVMLMQAADAELDRDPAQARRHLAMAERTARENLTEARALIGALTPAALADASLVAAVGRLVDRFTEETGTRTSWSVHGTPRALPTAVEVVLLRAVQESLANARKHAGAVTVTARLRYGDDGAAVEVHDDGRGFTPASTAEGYGLAAMRTRVEQVGGTMTVDSAPGTGTTVRVEVPA